MSSEATFSVGWVHTNKRQCMYDVSSITKLLTVHKIRNFAESRYIMSHRGTVDAAPLYLTEEGERDAKMYI